MCLFKYINKNIHLSAKISEDSVFKQKLPSNLTVGVGKPLKLQAQVYGVPLPNVQWFKHGIPLLPSEHVKIDIQPDGTVTLTIDQTKPEDKGKYELRATIPDGTAASVSNVTVSGKLWIFPFNW